MYAHTYAHTYTIHTHTPAQIYIYAQTHKQNNMHTERTQNAYTQDTENTDTNNHAQDNAQPQHRTVHTIIVHIV